MDARIKPLADPCCDPNPRALAYPSPLAPWLTRKCCGVVLAAFRRSAYLRLEGDDAGAILALVSKELGRGPLSVVVEDMAWEQIRAGETVHIAPEALIVGTIRIGTAQAVAWDPRLPRGVFSATFLDACTSWLVHAAPQESLAPLLPCLLDGAPACHLPPWQHRALQGAQALLQGDLVDGVRCLCGLGPGLTPSGDDFLCGWMLALRTLGQDPEVLAQHARATHRIARAYLKAAAQGYASEAWHQFLHAIPGGNWQTPAQAILRTGETSGADTLAGFLAALRSLPAASMA